MKPCHKQNYLTRTAAVQRTSPPSRTVSQTPVHRYIHPIRTTRPTARNQTEELLAGILESLSHQSEQLEEVLRRLGRDNFDTM